MIAILLVDYPGQYMLSGRVYPVVQEYKDNVLIEDRGRNTFVMVPYNEVILKQNKRNNE